MNNIQAEEQAFLHALDQLNPEERAELMAEMARDPEVGDLVREYDQLVSALSYDAPQMAPPGAVKQLLLMQLPAERPKSKIIAFPTWLPYAVAACLMALAVYQMLEVMRLQIQLARSDDKVARLKESNALLGLRLTALESVNASYVNSKVVVAWDAKSNRGIVSMQKLPPPTPGHDYQLWILDPKSAAPVSIGVVKTETGESAFASKPVSTATPGFAISLEPTGGSEKPTAGAILFAVAPGT